MQGRVRVPVLFVDKQFHLVSPKALASNGGSPESFWWPLRCANSNFGSNVLDISTLTAVASLSRFTPISLSSQ
jgi:hypothetical protein